MKEKERSDNVKTFAILMLVAIVITIIQGFGMVSASSFYGTFKQGECIEIIQSCYTGSAMCDEVNISYIAYPNSSTLLRDVVMEKRVSDFNYTFCNSNTLGTYSIGGVGYPLDNNPNFYGTFEVTPNGKQATIGTAIFYIGLLVVLIVFLILCLSAFVKFENLLSRVGMLGLSYLILIAITFIAWNMSADFITSAPFLISFFRISFWVLIVGFFPLILGGFAWYFIQIFKIKEIQRLMDKGFSLEDAERRVGRKK